MKAQAHGLRLVYPPITNQHAEWLRKGETDVAAAMKRSNLYMVAHRAEARFLNLRYEEEAGTIEATFNVPGVGDSAFSVDVGGIAQDDGLKTFELDASEQHIRVWKGEKGEHTDVADWFTSEKLLYDKSRGHPHVHGLDLCREFATYELLYVGISKEGDSFGRLIKRAHEHRQRVLSNAYPKKPGSRVTDEIVIFFFAVHTTFINTAVSTDDNVVDTLFDFAKDKLRVIADAEKALIHILEPVYNENKYPNYPRCTDGLYKQGVDAYLYALAEDITFTTKKGTLRGDRTFPDPAANVDVISVEGETVRFVERPR